VSGCDLTSVKVDNKTTPYLEAERAWSEYSSRFTVYVSHFAGRRKIVKTIATGVRLCEARLLCARISWRIDRHPRWASWPQVTMARPAPWIKLAAPREPAPIWVQEAGVRPTRRGCDPVVVEVGQ